MNEFVEQSLKELLASVEEDIKWTRSELSDLSIGAAKAGNKLDGLTAERRAIVDHLTLNGVEL